MSQSLHKKTALEAVLLRDQLMVGAGLAAAITLAWAWLLPMSRDMYGRMDGPAAWMMAGTWDLRYGVLMFGMWAAMMLGMMLPSAAPAILLYGRVARSGAQPENPVLRSYAFAAGYLLAWTAFSLAATILQWGLSVSDLLSPMMETDSGLLAGSILLVSGVYQWTPLKQTCLAGCRTPAGFISQHWRPGAAGALRMGASHGLYCVGCCWALMLLLFFGGVMSLTWIAALTLAVLFEKLVPYGGWAGRLGGLALIASGMLVLWRA